MFRFPSWLLRFLAFRDFVQTIVELTGIKEPFFFLSFYFLLFRLVFLVALRVWNRQLRSYKFAIMMVWGF
jgi:hypothetical protein